MELIDSSLAVKLATREQRLNIKIEDRVVESDIYGKYVSSLIGIIDLFKFDLDANEDWWNKWHPKNNSAHAYSVLCSDYIGRIETEDPMQNGRYVFIWVALDSTNKEWRANNPDCKYLLDVPKARKFPVGWTDKQHSKYLDKFSKYMIK